MPETDAAHRLLTRLMTRLRERRRAPAGTLAVLALLAARLGHPRPAASLTRLALGGGRITDYRVSWLLYRLARECPADAGDGRAGVRVPGRHETAATLAAQYRLFTGAAKVDLLNGAGGAGMALWDLAGEPVRDEITPSLRATAGAILRRTSNGLYHGRAGGILLLRMTGCRCGEDPAQAEAIDALVRDVERLDAAALDTGELGIGGVTLCYGIPGMLAALGPAADPDVLARISRAPVTRASLARLDGHLAGETADAIVCHGLAGAGLAGRLSPCWRDLMGPDRTARVAARLAGWLDRVGDEAVDAVFGTSIGSSVLEGPIGVALVLAETTTTTPPWWGIGVSLGDGTSAVAGRTTTGATA